MDNLKKPIGQMLSSRKLKTIDEYTLMTEVAETMLGDSTDLHLSQLPVIDGMGRCGQIVTTNELARWGKYGTWNDVANPSYCEPAQTCSLNTPLANIVKTVANFGYVLVVEDDHRPIGIISYTEVIEELTKIIVAKEKETTDVKAEEGPRAVDQ